MTLSSTPVSEFFSWACRSCLHVTRRPKTDPIEPSALSFQGAISLFFEGRLVSNEAALLSFGGFSLARTVKTVPIESTPKRY